MSRIYIKPAKAGLLVRHPEKLSHRIPPEGEWVTESLEWQRYLDAGDVVLAEGPSENPPEAKVTVKGNK